MKRNKNLYPHPDGAACQVLANFHAPDGSMPVPEQYPHYQRRMEAMGVTVDIKGNSDQGYLLKSLTSRATILEAAWLRVMQQLSETTHPNAIGNLTRAANHLNQELNRTMTLILRVRNAQAENRAPYLGDDDQKLLDDRLALTAMGNKVTLDTAQIKEAYKRGVEVYEAE